MDGEKNEIDWIKDLNPQLLLSYHLSLHFSEDKSNK